jgi:transposase
MPDITVGVDIAKKKFDVARLEDGKYRHKVFENTPAGFAAFVSWLAAFGPAEARIVMEATGAYGLPLADYLTGQGLWVGVVNPARIKAFGKSEGSRTKTDKADAKLIARYAQARKLLRWTPPPPALRELDALLRRVEQLLDMRQMERNRLDTAGPAAAPSIQNLLAALEKELDATREAIRRRIDDDPDLPARRDLLESIPGLGEATVAHLLVLFGDHHGFQNAKQAVAFVGLAPNPHQSGQAEAARLDKTGDARLRKALYMPALVAWRHNPVIREFCERLKARGKNGKSVACAAMRKLLHLAFGILKSGKKFDPEFKVA